MYTVGQSPDRRGDWDWPDLDSALDAARPWQESQDVGDLDALIDELDDGGTDCGSRRAAGDERLSHIGRFCRREPAESVGPPGRVCCRICVDLVLGAA